MIADPNDVMTECAVIRLCGNEGKDLLTKLKADNFQNEIVKYRSLFEYFSVKFRLFH